MQPSISRFLPLANRIARLRFARRGNRHARIDVQDLVQSAMERLCATLSDCTDEEQDSKAERTIVWAMQDELRRQDPLTRDQRQAVRAGESHQPYLVYEDDPLSGEDVADEFSDPSLILHHRHEVQVLRAQISRLSDLQRQAVEWFLSEQPQDELAKKLGTSKSNVSKAKAAAMAHLRTRLIAFGVHR